jgi:hypothetical protein
LHGARVGVADQTLGHAVNIAAQCAAQVGQQIALGQIDRERAAGAKLAVGGGGETVELAEVFVKRREGIEADAERDFGERCGGGEEPLFGEIEAGAEEEIGGRGVIVQAKKFECAGGAEAGATDDGAGVGELGGVGADFGNEGFNGFQDRIGAAGEIVGVTFFAGTEAGGAGGFARGEKANVLRLGFAGFAGREAIDAGGEHAGEKAAVVGRVARENTRIHGGRSHSHGRKIAGADKRVVRLISEQFR